MTAKLTFVVPMQTVRILSANARSHWAKKARATKEVRELARATASVQRVWMERAHVTVTIGWPDRKRRDVANTHPVIKAAIDGVVDAGWLDDDDDSHLTGPDLRSTYGGGRGVALVTMAFTPLAAEGVA